LFWQSVSRTRANTAVVASMDFSRWIATFADEECNPNMEHLPVATRRFTHFLTKSCFTDGNSSTNNVVISVMQLLYACMSKEHMPQRTLTLSDFAVAAANSLLICDAIRQLASCTLPPLQHAEFMIAALRVIQSKAEAVQRGLTLPLSRRALVESHAFVLAVSPIIKCTDEPRRRARCFTFNPLFLLLCVAAQRAGYGARKNYLLRLSDLLYPGAPDVPCTYATVNALNAYSLSIVLARNNASFHTRGLEVRARDVVIVSPAACQLQTFRADIDDDGVVRWRALSARDDLGKWLVHSQTVALAKGIEGEQYTTAAFDLARHCSRVVGSKSCELSHFVHALHSDTAFQRSFAAATGEGSCDWKMTGELGCLGWLEVYAREATPQLCANNLQSDCTVIIAHVLPDPFTVYTACEQAFYLCAWELIFRMASARAEARERAYKRGSRRSDLLRNLADAGRLARVSADTRVSPANALQAGADLQTPPHEVGSEALMFDIEAQRLVATSGCDRSSVLGVFSLESAYTCAFYQDAAVVCAASPADFNPSSNSPSRSLFVDCLYSER
jgi:hypothetical protein